MTGAKPIARLIHTPSFTMPEYNEGESSNNRDSQSPDTRSRYTPKAAALTFPELYTVGQSVYLHGARGIDPNPYRIYEVLGNGQYRLSRNSIVERGTFREDDLQTRP